MSVGELRGGRVTVRDLRPEDVGVLLAMRRRPEIARWWGRGDDDWPANLDGGEQLLTIEVGGEIAGHVELYEEIGDPDWRWASLDIFVAPDVIGKGYGTEALRLVIDYLIDQRGHHRITIDPAVDNEIAIRSYAKAGFEPVGTMRKYWRDSEGVWRDSVLMELVTEPPVAGP